MSSHEARKRAFGAVRETCPAVDDAMGELIDGLNDLTVGGFKRDMPDLVKKATDAVKEKTNELRDALVSAYEELIEAEAEVAGLKQDLERAQAEAAALRNELNSMGVSA